MIPSLSCWAHGGVHCTFSDSERSKPLRRRSKLLSLSPASICLAVEQRLISLSRPYDHDQMIVDQMYKAPLLLVYVGAVLFSSFYPRSSCHLQPSLLAIVTGLPTPPEYSIESTPTPSIFSVGVASLPSSADSTHQILRGRCLVKSEDVDMA